MGAARMVNPTRAVSVYEIVLKATSLHGFKWDFCKGLPFLYLPIEVSLVHIKKFFSGTSNLTETLITFFFYSFAGSIS